MGVPRGGFERVERVERVGLFFFLLLLSLYSVRYGDGGWGVGGLYTWSGGKTEVFI